VLFAALVLLWMFRRDVQMGTVTIPGWTGMLPVPGYVDDGTIAIALALVLFLIPSRSRPGTRLMDWQTAVGLQWGIVLLFGGGFALAIGFKESGLSQWLGGQLAGAAGFHPVGLVMSVSTMLTFLTELTSNTATTEMVLPVLAALGTAIEVNPLLLMIPATLSASCAFMLPVATPPNAIVFGTGEVTMADMIRGGIVLNLIGVILITVCVFAVGTAAFGIELGVLPEWALSASP
jgi:sodium-dependent dicarboxylate transporter 2/3/5